MRHSDMGGVVEEEEEVVVEARESVEIAAAEVAGKAASVPMVEGFCVWLCSFLFWGKGEKCLKSELCFGGLLYIGGKEGGVNWMEQEG